MHKSFAMNATGLTTTPHALRKNAYFFHSNLSNYNERKQRKRKRLRLWI